MDCCTSIFHLDMLWAGSIVIWRLSKSEGSPSLPFLTFLQLHPAICARIIWSQYESLFFTVACDIPIDFWKKWRLWHLLRGSMALPEAKWQFCMQRYMLNIKTLGFLLFFWAHIERQWWRQWKVAPEPRRSIFMPTQWQSGWLWEISFPNLKSPSLEGHPRAFLQISVIWAFPHEDLVDRSLTSVGWISTSYHQVSIAMFFPLRT